MKESMVIMVVLVSMVAGSPTDWGETNNHEGFESISINFSGGKVGDMALTILHEACHAILGDPPNDEARNAEHQSIYNVEYSYLLALSWAGVEFSSGDITKGEKNFVMHVTHLCFYGFGYNQESQVPLSEILTRWIQGSVLC